MPSNLSVSSELEVFVPKTAQAFMMPLSEWRFLYSKIRQLKFEGDVYRNWAFFFLGILGSALFCVVQTPSVVYWAAASAALVGSALCFGFAKVRKAERERHIEEVAEYLDHISVRFAAEPQPAPKQQVEFNQATRIKNWCKTPIGKQTLFSCVLPFLVQLIFLSAIKIWPGIQDGITYRGFAVIAVLISALSVLAIPTTPLRIFITILADVPVMLCLVLRFSLLVNHFFPPGPIPPDQPSPQAPTSSQQSSPTPSGTGGH